MGFDCPDFIAGGLVLDYVGGWGRKDGDVCVCVCVYLCVCASVSVLCNDFFIWGFQALG